MGKLNLKSKHRLLIDDCTVKENVERLMAGEKADMVFTDPPYGVDYDGGTTKREKLANDDSAAIYGRALPLLVEFSSDKAPFYIWYADGDEKIIASVIASGLDVRNNLVWNKNMAQFGALSAQYKQKHEPFLYCHKKGKAPFWDGPTNEVTVWDASRASKNEFHPTQKPVELAERAIKNSSPVSGAILDFFSGSGSTLIACEKTDRRCFGMEIEPLYGDVILSRWAKFTDGGDPVREDGVRWSDLQSAEPAEGPA